MANKTLIILGVILIATGIFTGSYTVSQQHLWGLYSTSSTPYASYSIGLFIGGIIIIIIGVLLKPKALESITEEIEEIPKKIYQFCSHCGQKIKKGVKYCSECGKRL